MQPMFTNPSIASAAWRISRLSRGSVISPSSIRFFPESLGHATVQKGKIAEELEESWEISDGKFLGAAFIADATKETPDQEDLTKILEFCIDNLVSFSIH